MGYRIVSRAGEPRGFLWLGQDGHLRVSGEGASVLTRLVVSMCSTPLGRSMDNAKFLETLPYRWNYYMGDLFLADDLPDEQGTVIARPAEQARERD